MSVPADDMEFRSLAAPGLEEDDIFAALYGLPGDGGMWGDGMPDAFPPTDPPWDAARDRASRRQDALDRWPIQADARAAGKD